MIQLRGFLLKSCKLCRKANPEGAIKPLLVIHTVLLHNAIEAPNLGILFQEVIAGRVYKFSLKQDNVFHKTVFQGKEKVTKTHKKMTSNVCSSRFIE